MAASPCISMRRRQSTDLNAKKLKQPADRQSGVAGFRPGDTFFFRSALRAIRPNRQFKLVEIGNGELPRVIVEPPHCSLNEAAQGPEGSGVAGSTGARSLSPNADGRDLTKAVERSFSCGNICVQEVIHAWVRIASFARPLE